MKKTRKAREEDISEIAIHLDCEHDVDSILHTIREIQADLEIAKEAAAPSSAEPVAYIDEDTLAKLKAGGSGVLPIRGRNSLGRPECNIPLYARPKFEEWR